MTIHEYLEECILILTTSPIIEHFHLIKRRETATDGYLRIQATITDSSTLEISIYCKITEGIAHINGYRFHWQDKEKKLIRRWDNAKHHPELKTFPAHMHIGSDENVKESDDIDLWKVLQIIKSETGRVYTTW